MTRPPDSPHATAAPSEKIFTVGTLRYTKKDLRTLFVWLMLNEFCLLLFEQLPQLNVVLYKDNGASYATMGFFSAFTTLGLIWLNPVFSTWSDRHRGRFGRRRPFLLAAAPPFAFFLGALGFMPDLGRWLERSPHASTFFHHIGISGPVLMIGLCSFVALFFSGILMALFLYFYWDVVPEEVLGRFNSLGKIVGTAVSFIWLYWLFGLAERHLHVLYIGLAAFFLTVFLVSAWKVKEGEYPPPEPRKKGGVIEAIRVYITDCYTQPFYLWVFGASALAQMSNMSGNVQFSYLHYDLGLSLDTIGKFRALPQLIVLPLGYALGALIDRLKPVRIVPMTMLLTAFSFLFAFHFVHGKWSFLAFGILSNVADFARGVAMGAMTVEVYPREKIGQFCSAHVFAYQIPILLFSIPVGRMWDYLHNDRYGFLWAAVLTFLSCLAYYKVYWNWLRKQEDPNRSKTGAVS